MFQFFNVDFWLLLLLLLLLPPRRLRPFFVVPHLCSQLLRKFLLRKKVIAISLVLVLLILVLTDCLIFVRVAGCSISPPWFGGCGALTPFFLRFALIVLGHLHPKLVGVGLLRIRWASLLILILIPVIVIIVVV